MTPPVTTRCEFYNTSCAAQPGSCDEVAECEAPGENKRNHCFVLWSLQPDGSKNVSLKVKFVFFLHVLYR